MLYLIGGFIAGFIFVGVVAGGFDQFLKMIAFFMSILFATIFWGIGESTKLTHPDYKPASKVYSLKEMEESQYFKTNTDGNSVSVWIMDGQNWKEKIFPKEKVVFTPATEEAEVKVEFKEMIEPTLPDKIWLFKSSKGHPKERYKSVVISIPE